MSNGRSDVRGATRFSVFLVAIWVAAWAFGADHYRAWSVETQRFSSFLGPVLVNTAIVWLSDVALEPDA